MLRFWVPYYIGGRWPYWQCATPTGPYNYQAKDARAAWKWADRQRRLYAD